MPAAPASDDTSALLRLITWLSPAYPVGGYAYSHGLEWAVEAGEITDRAGLERWVADILELGGGRNDGVLFTHAHAAAARHDGSALATIAELAAALSASAERQLETIAQGRAFIEVTAAAWPCAALDLLAQSWQGPIAHPVAVAVAAAGHGIGLEVALPAYLHGFAANLVSAGVRLVPLGQTDGQRIIAALEPVIRAVSEEAAKATLDDLGGVVLRADLASMRHETQQTRLFRS